MGIKIPHDQMGRDAQRLLMRQPAVAENVEVVLSQVPADKFIVPDPGPAHNDTSSVHPYSPPLQNAAFSQKQNQAEANIEVFLDAVHCPPLISSV